MKNETEAGPDVALLCRKAIMTTTDTNQESKVRPIGRQRVHGQAGSDQRREDVRSRGTGARRLDWYHGE